MSGDSLSLDVIASSGRQTHVVAHVFPIIRRGYFLSFSSLSKGQNHQFWLWQRKFEYNFEAFSRRNSVFESEKLKFALVCRENPVKAPLRSRG